MSKNEPFRGAKVIAHDILLTVERFILTLAVNRQVYHEPLCAFSHNSLHYHQSYRETKSEDDEILKKSTSALRVKVLLQLILKYAYMLYIFIHQFDHTIFLMAFCQVSKTFKKYFCK